MPEVSICIPAYKNPEFLGRAVDSVLIQTFTDYEIIITDDTPDNSLETMVKQQYGNIKNLRYYKNSKTLGSTANWNYSISLAKSGLIKILHHDDWFSDKNSLQTLVNPLLKDPKIDFVFCQSNLYKGNNLIKIQKPGLSEVDYLKIDCTTILYRNFIAPSATLFRHNSDNFDYNLIWLADADFYARYLENSEFQYIQKPLMNLNISEGRLTSFCLDNLQLLMNEMIYLFNKYKSSPNAEQNILKYFRWVVRSFSLYDIERLKVQSGIDEIPAEFENLIRNITFPEKLFDFLFRKGRTLKRLLLTMQR